MRKGQCGFDTRVCTQTESPGGSTSPGAASDVVLSVVRQVEHVSAAGSHRGPCPAVSTSSAGASERRRLTAEARAVAEQLYLLPAAMSLAADLLVPRPTQPLPLCTGRCKYDMLDLRVQLHKPWARCAKYLMICLQCFDIVGWVAGRASGL